MMFSENPELVITSLDKEIWDEELEDFVPKNIFDIHTEINDCLLFILIHTSLTQGMHFILQLRPLLFYILKPLIKLRFPRVSMLFFRQRWEDMSKIRVVQ